MTFASEADLAAWGQYAPSPDAARSALDAATDLIRDYCGWHIAPSVTETLTLDGNTAGVLAIPTLKLTSVVSVTIDGTLHDPAVYEWSQSGYLRLYGGHRLRSVAVAVVHGFPVVPEVVKSVCLTVAARALASPEGFIREQFGSAGQTPTQTSPGAAGGIALMSHEMRTLARYTIPALP